MSEGTFTCQKCQNTYPIQCKIMHEIHCKGNNNSFDKNLQQQMNQNNSNFLNNQQQPEHDNSNKYPIFNEENNSSGFNLFSNSSYSSNNNNLNVNHQNQFPNNSRNKNYNNINEVNNDNNNFLSRSNENPFNNDNQQYQNSNFNSQINSNIQQNNQNRNSQLDFVDCPICNMKVKTSELEDHKIAHQLDIEMNQEQPNGQQNNHHHNLPFNNSSQNNLRNYENIPGSNMNSHHYSNPFDRNNDFQGSFNNFNEHQNQFSLNSNPFAQPRNQNLFDNRYQNSIQNPFQANSFAHSNPYQLNPPQSNFAFAPDIPDQQIGCTTESRIKPNGNMEIKTITHYQNGDVEEKIEEKDQRGILVKTTCNKYFNNENQGSQPYQQNDQNNFLSHQGYDQYQQFPNYGLNDNLPYVEPEDPFGVDSGIFMNNHLIRNSGIPELFQRVNQIIRGRRYENPADSNIVERLPESKITDASKLSDEKKNCNICLEEFVNGDIFITLPCLHIFHKDCIKKWLSTQNFCPICRNVVNENNLG